MGIDFNWQAGDEGGQWEVIAEQRRRKRRRRIPRWLRYLLLATIALAATGGYVVVRQRYQQAHQQMVFQIQGVIDLEANAYARGDADLFMEQQDDASPDWYDLQQERIEADCPRDAPPSARCVPVLPAEILEVDLREDVAWVEVLEDEPPVRRARFYHQTELGWKHTAPQIAFWSHAIELHYGDLVFRYHERDQPHVDPLVDHIAKAFYETCAHVDCPSDRSFQVNFAVDPVLSTRVLPPFQDNEWILPSPWLSGLPVDGEWSEAQLGTLAYAIAHGLATQTLRTAPEHQLDPLQRALVAEYAAWQGMGHRDAAPLLSRIVDSRGEGVLPPLFRWLRDDQQRHTLGLLLGRWLDYPLGRLSAQQFQELLQIERDTLLAGQRDTFMLLQEGEQALWRLQQEAFYEQARDVLRSTSVSLPSIRVESVRVSRGRAMVTLREPLVNVRGEAAQSLGQYVFFTLDREGWKHSSIGYALHWRVPFSMVRRAPSLSRQEADPDVMWITYASSEPRSQVEARVASFHAQHPGIRVRVLDMGDVLSFPDEGLADENNLILYLYQLLAYQGAVMSDVMDLPVFSELSLYGRYTNLALQEQVMPNPFEWLSTADRRAYSGQMWNIVAQGQAAMWVDDAQAWDHRASGNVGVVPFPTSTYPRSPWLVTAYTISAESAHPEESWAWLAFLTEQQETMDDQNNTAYTLPARRSVAEVAGSWAQWDDEAADAIRSAMEDAWIYRLDECTLTLEAAIESIWAGTSVEAALDEAQAQLMGQ